MVAIDHGAADVRDRQLIKIERLGFPRTDPPAPAIIDIEDGFKRMRFSERPLFVECSS